MTIDWGDAPAWAAAALSVGALWYARHAAKSSQTSAGASETSAKAAVRQAAAAERQVELAEAALKLAEAQAIRSNSPLDTGGALEALAAPPKDYVAWMVLRLSPNRYLLRNVGTTEANDVEIDTDRIKCVFRGDTSAAEVAPNASMELMLHGLFGAPKPNELWVRWKEHPEWLAVPL